MRFHAQDKSPSCVPRDWILCNRVAGFTADVKTPSELGFAEDSVRNLCVPQSVAGFD